MRRIVLDPPRTILDPPAAEGAEDRVSVRIPRRGTLDEPSPARERRRWLFHPKRGWFRRLERRVNNWLASAVYPGVPGIHTLYDGTLLRSLTLSETEIALPGLHASLDGLRLLLVTDVHAGPFVSPTVLTRTFERLNTLGADAILLGGDLVTGRVDEFRSNREAFRILTAPLGVHAVLGNHDHYTEQPARLRGMIAACGIGVLHNRSIRLRRGAGELALAGVDDMLLGEPDLDAALEDTRGPVVLLSHNPDLFFDAARRSVALMLSGHTHAGQIRVPRLPVLVRQSRYRLDEGRYRRGGTELVVSRGLGAVGLPLRVACPPEVVMVRLLCAPPDPRPASR